MEIGIIGKGRVGGALCRHLAIKRIVKGKAEMGQAKLVLSSCEVIFLTVPDRCIGEVAQQLSDLEESFLGKVFFHCSGSLGLEVLECLRVKGAHVGSLHPLQSFAGGMADFRGIYVAVDGDNVARELGKELAAKLSAQAFYVPAAERKRYHAAACLASNYVVTLLAMASKLLGEWTGSEKAALQALLPLLDGTTANLHLSDAAGQALTGPIARGDVNTLQGHLEELPEEYRELYKVLGLATAELAYGESLLSEERFAAVRQLLKAK